MRTPERLCEIIHSINRDLYPNEFWLLAGTIYDLERRRRNAGTSWLAMQVADLSTSYHLREIAREVYHYLRFGD